MSLSAQSPGREALPGLGTVPLHRFLQKLPPELRVLHDAQPPGDDAAPLTVRWVEPSELEDPTPYLLEGEFILTAGLPFTGRKGSEPEVDRYVQRLVQANVCALGFGITPYFDDVPVELLEACRRHNLTLVELPASVPFAAVGLEFARMLEAETLQALRTLSEVNRQLMRSVLAGRPEQELLQTLTRWIPAWALIVGSDGRVRVRVRGGNTELRGQIPSDAELQPLLRKLLAGRGPRIEVDSFDSPGARAVVGYPLRSTRDANLGALVVGSEERLGPLDRNIVEVAVGLLEALVRQRTSGALAPGQLATGLLLRPSPGSAREQANLEELLVHSTSGTHPEPVRVVRGVPRTTGQHDDDVRGLLQWRRLFDTKLVEISDDGFAAITRLAASDALIAEVEQTGWLLAVSDPVEPAALPHAFRQATSLLRHAVHSGRSVRAETVAWTITGLLGDEAGKQLASRIFAPLKGVEPERSALLLQVLSAWLQENGNWDASARELGLHRNSVRRQIRLLGDLLELDLADASTRAELLIALNYVDEP